MAYISTEEVKRIRDEVKQIFPAKEGWKFSITREDWSGVNVKIMESRINFTDGKKDNYEVNHYYIDEHFKEQPELASIFKKIDSIINGVRQNVDSNFGDLSADYPSYNYFYHIGVGKWDKAFKLVK